MGGIIRLYIRLFLLIPRMTNATMTIAITMMATTAAIGLALPMYMLFVVTA